MQMIIAYLWNSVLSVLLVLAWIKLEIIGERIYQQFEYQKLINIETTKELTGLIKEVKGLKVRRNTSNISPVTIRRNIPSYYRDLNSEEILFNSLLNENEIIEDIYEDLDNNSDEELQELSVEGTNYNIEICALNPYWFN